MEWALVSFFIALSVCHRHPTLATPFPQADPVAAPSGVAVSRGPDRLACVSPIYTARSLVLRQTKEN